VNWLTDKLFNKFRDHDFPSPHERASDASQKPIKRKPKKSKSKHLNEVVIERSGHCITRANISKNALTVLYGLNRAGYDAHLVGGGVRDLLLGKEPKDFDVATDAHPEQVNKVFRNCRLIGRRFRLAHVHFGREIIEVATFRSNQEADTSDSHKSDEGMILRDNVYGDIEDDAVRRDFTINALYYNVRDFSVTDYTDGMADLKNGLIRLIGDPETRYREDPVRMIRAIRFAAKLDFKIETATETPIKVLAPLLDDVPAARLYEEMLKLFLSGHAVKSFHGMRDYGVFDVLFPSTSKALADTDQAFPMSLIMKGLKNTDLRISESKPVTPAFLFAVLLWEPVRILMEEALKKGLPPYPALQQSATTILDEQIPHVAIPRRFTTPMREIWSLQARFDQTKGKRPAKLITHPRFKAAYDFLLLRADVGEADPKLAKWWVEFFEKNQDQVVKPTVYTKKKRRPPRRKKIDNKKDDKT